MYDERITKSPYQQGKGGWYVRRDQDEDTVEWEGPFPSYEAAFNRLQAEETLEETPEAAEEAIRAFEARCRARVEAL